jgi:hypothetical protein
MPPGFTVLVDGILIVGGLTQQLEAIILLPFATRIRAVAAWNCAPIEPVQS